MALLRKGIFSVSMTMVGLLALAAEKSWTPSEGGSFTWDTGSNWGGSVPTSSDTAKFAAPSGDQTITGDGEAGVLDVNDGADPAKMRDFTGNLTVGRLIFRQGVMNLTGKLTITNTEGTFSLIGTSQWSPSGMSKIEKMVVSGTLEVPNKHALCVARGSDGNTSANGYLQLNGDGRLLFGAAGSGTSMSGLMLGRTSEGTSTAPFLNAGFVQVGGYSRINRLMAGFEPGARASVVVLDGEVYLPFGSDVRYRIGHRGYGSFQQLGGKIFVMTNSVQQVDVPEFAAESFEIGGAVARTSGSGGAAFYSAGGLLTATSDFIIQGNTTSAESGETPSMSATVDGSGVLDLRRLIIGGNKTKGGAYVNVNGGGRCEVFLVTNACGRLGPSVLSGNGGTIVIKEAQMERSQFAGLDSIDVYAGGIVMECNAKAKIGNEVTVVKLRSPKGYGVESISYSGTQEYYYAPYVEISGGSGSNATAVALVDWADTHRVTNVVVTCRGEGYQPNDTITVKFTKPSTSGLESVAVATTVTLSENKPGAFVKTGSERLTIYSQPEYDGVYEVREGLVVQSTDGVGSAKVSQIRVGGSNAEFQCASGNRQDKQENRINKVNANAVLALGTDFGSGVFSLPAGQDKDNPYVQNFAKLQVRGTGNVIRPAGGDTKGNVPVRLTFDAFDFAEGSQVVLSTNSEFRVYAPVAMAGQFLKSVTFEGKVGKKIGYVAADGQIVPKSFGGMILVVR